jgi:hypothetical protein
MKKTKLIVVLLGSIALSQFALAQIGSTFTNPVIVTSLPLLETGATTCGFGNEYTTVDIACAGNFMSGEDKIYRYTPTVNMSNMQVSMTNISDNFSGLFITDDSTAMGSCLGSSYNTGSGDRVVSNLSFTAGMAYYFIVSTWANPNCVSFDFQVLDQTCPAVDSLALMNITSANVTIDWVETGSATSWIVEYGPAGFLLGNGSPVTVTATPYTINGLSPNTNYDVYVKTICGAAVTSYSVGLIGLTTLCVSGTMPYLQDFSSWPDPCWDLTGGTRNWLVSGAFMRANFWGWPNGSAFMASKGISVVNNAQLNFKWSHLYSTSYPGDSMEVQVKVLPSGNWTTIWVKGGADLESNDGAGNTSPGSFVRETVYLDPVLYTGNEVSVRFIGTSGFGPNLYLDSIAIKTAPTCLPPINLTSSSVGSSAIISWNELGFATQWEYEYDGTGFTLGTGNSNVILNDSFNITGLTPISDYQFYVRSVCGSNDSSAWSGPFSFSTTAICPAPISLTTSVSGNTAQLNWAEFGSATLWQYEYGASGFTIGTGTGDTTSIDSASLSGLSYSANYSFYVRAICGAGDTSAWSAPFDFFTPCAINVPYYSENFSSFVPLCWEEAGDGTQVTGPTQIGFGNWRSSAALGASVAINMYTVGSNEWVLSPFFDLSAGPYELAMDVAVTNWLNASPDAMGSDDSVKVLYTEDGVVWNSIGAFTQVDGLTNTLSSYVFPLTSIGSNVQFAILASDGSINDLEDYDFHLDNFVVQSPPTCTAPISFASSSITSTSITVDWTELGIATSWQVEYGVTGYTLGTGISSGGVTTKPHTIPSLNANTEYEVYVRSVCGSSDSSNWVGPITVFTGYCAPAPINVDGNGITNVSMDTLNNTTGAEPGNYGNYSSMIAVAEQASSLSINLTLQTGYTYNLWAWIDWNDDLDFDDVGEANYLGESVSTNPTTFIGQVFIPYSIAIGNHRIRIGGSDAGLGLVAPSFPCYAGSWASFEDYTLEIVAPTGCIATDSLSVINLLPTSVDLSWVDYNASTTWEIEYDDSLGFVLGSSTGTRLSTSTNPHSLVGLNSNSDYEYYVRAICAAGDSASWVGPFSFRTPCLVISTFPFLEGFEPTSPTIGCWKNEYVTGAENWDIASGALGGSITAPFTGSFNLVFVSQFGTNEPITNAISPTFDVTSLIAPRISFYYAQEEIVGSQNYTRVIYRANSTDSWTEIWGDSSNVDVWSKVIVNLPNPSASYQIAFQGINNGGGRNVIDEFTVEETPGNDLMVVDVRSASSECGLGIDSIMAVIVNNGSASQTGFSIGFTLDGVAIMPELFTGTLAAFDTVTYSFNNVPNFSSPGKLDIEAYTILSGDVDLTNDTSMDEISKTYLIDSYPYIETFAVGEEGWEIENNAAGSWAFGEPNKSVIIGAASGTNCFVTSLTGTYQTNDISYVNSPCFDFTTLNDPKVQMSSWWESFGGWEGASVEYSLNSGDSWSTLGDVGEGENWYNSSNIFANGNSAWSGTGINSSNGWVSTTIPAPFLAGEPSVKFRVVFASSFFGGFDGFAFDDFAVFNGSSLGNDTILCSAETVTLNPGGYSGYLWSDSSSMPLKFLDAATMSIGTDTVSVIVSGPGGFKMYDTVVVTVEKPIIDLGNDTLVCFGKTVTLNAGTGFSSFIWSNSSAMQTVVTNGTIAGTVEYSVLGLTANDCPATDSINVSVNTEVLVDLGVDTVFTDSVTQGVSYTLDAGSGFLSYVWSDSSTAQTYFIDENAIDGIITVVVTNSSGCEGSDTVVVDFKLGVNSEEVSQIRMYPNPATEMITVEVSNFSALGEVDVNILDISGKMVLTKKLRGNGAVFNETYDVSNLATGTYFVQFMAKGELVTRQFVIK